MNLESLNKSPRSIMFLVMEAVGEYPVFQGPASNIREMYSGFQLEEYLEHLEPSMKGKTPMEIDEMKKSILSSMVKEWRDPDNVNKYNVCVRDIDMEEHADYYSITLWADESESITLEQAIANYLEDYEEDLKSEWLKAGGDDTWYDYMPSYTDVYRQICEAVQEYDRYNAFVAWYTQNLDGSEFSLYVASLG